MVVVGILNKGGWKKVELQKCVNGVSSNYELELMNNGFFREEFR